jgi:U4/U6.U5 tri-snRNP-associated protein 1
VRNRRELHASLKGATLGDADADTDDTLKWIKKSKKKEKELARKRQEEIENMEKGFRDEDYTESTCFYKHMVQFFKSDTLAFRGSCGS